MASRHARKTLRDSLKDLFWGPQLLAFLPAICLAAYWTVGEGGLIAAALGVPVVWSILGGRIDAKGSDTGTALRDPAHDAVSMKRQMAQLLGAAKPDERSSVFALGLDDMDGFTDRYGQAIVDDILDQITGRMRSILRSNDIVTLVAPFTWIIGLSPGTRLDLETTIQQANRLQTVTDDPVAAGNTRLYFTAGVGFTMVRNAREDDLPRIIEEASTALLDAQQAGPNSVRAYSVSENDPSRTTADGSTYIVTSTSKEITDRVVAWFQPQVSTDTGEVTGFEALARMVDPDRGLLPPASFLPVLERAGRLEKLGEIMLRQGLEALQHWDDAKMGVDTIGINFSAQDLSNPKLYDKIAWELDRFDIAPRRLSIEVLESVIAVSAEDVITRNVIQLSELGCQIDLDDFGTGHSSISTLRRLPVSRLKIDRSFVARADLDGEQQKMVATIIMMADRLELTSLAEGVETVGEHAILAQLGCRYVQGFGIAKPMPLGETIAWMNSHAARFEAPPNLSHRAS